MLKQTDNHFRSTSTSRKSESGTKHVKLMTTQVNLSDDVIKVGVIPSLAHDDVTHECAKVLTKLGVKMTTKPSECTHLIARNVVRTEKFLCAISVAPFVLSESWALQSAVAKMLLRQFPSLCKIIR